MSCLSVAALQLRFSYQMDADIAMTVDAVRAAAARGARVILPPELFQGHYFCKDQSASRTGRAFPVESHPAIRAMQHVAREEKVYIPASFFEMDGPHYYNALAMIDDQGDIMGVYRKAHIPDGPGYQEKFYFRPGNSGFKVWETRYGRLGVGICWDQWFPEAARAMMLMGADILLYPTAIGAEPHMPDMDTFPLWRRAMVGHAVSNIAPVVASNRVGDEGGQSFYGGSFICDGFGEIVAELGADETGAVIHRLDLDLWRDRRADFGFFRDRRPDHYQRLTQDI